MATALRSALSCACTLLALTCASAAAEDAAGPSDPARELARAKQCFEAAQAAYAKGKLAEAREGFTCAYVIEPSPELAWNLARVYERMGDPSQSIRFYVLYLESDALKPSERAAIEQRLAALEALRERQRAQVKGELPSQHELGDEAQTFFEHGVKLYRRGRYEAALAAFTAALRVSGAPELHYNLAVTSERLQRPSDALDHFRAYLAARPDADDKADVEARVAKLRDKLP